MSIFYSLAYINVLYWKMIKPVKNELFYDSKDDWVDLSSLIDAKKRDNSELSKEGSVRSSSPSLPAREDKSGFHFNTTSVFSVFDYG